MLGSCVVHTDAATATIDYFNFCLNRLFYVSLG